MSKKNTYCSFCGHRFQEDQPWPRTCASCGQVTFQNPLPVAVVLLPVDGGLLAVRRGIPPQRGMLALPGGYIQSGETWQQAGAREVAEETGVLLDPGELVEYRVRSTPDDAILIFGLAHPRRSGDLPPFVPNVEASERVVISGPEGLAFSLHAQVVALFFAERSG